PARYCAATGCPLRPPPTWAVPAVALGPPGARRPVEPSAKNPLRIKVRGENLVLFRDGSGKPGCSPSIAATGAPRSITAAWKRTASDVSITAGSTTSTGQCGANMVSWLLGSATSQLG